MRPEHLADSYAAYLDVIEALEGNARYRNLSPKGEPQLGKRGLYRAIGGGSFAEAPLLWVLNLSDGAHDLLAIAERSQLPFAAVRAAADSLAGAGLLEDLRLDSARASAPPGRGATLRPGTVWRRPGAHERVIARVDRSQ